MSSASLAYRRFVTVALVLVAGLPSLATIRESLWVDELHTSWSVAAPWNLVAPYASAGNQSPLYFWAIKLITGWLPLNEWTLRAPSLAAWCLMVAMVGWKLTSASLDNRRASSKRPRKIMIALIGLAWLGLDRIGLFYAIEARPYAWLALASTVLLLVPRVERHRTSIDWSWVACAILCVGLHFTALFIVVANWFGRCVVSTFFYDRNGSETEQGADRALRARSFEVLLVGVGILPWMPSILGTLGARKMWSLFAADTSLSSGLGLLPLLPWLGIPVAVVAITEVIWPRCLTWNRPSLAPVPSDNPGMAWKGFLVQALCTAIIPIAAVWLLTILQIAPLMHRRYVIGAYPAMLLAGGVCLWLLNGKQLFVVGVLSIATLVVQQETWRVWQAGQVIGWQRGEDWRQAIQYLNQNKQTADVIVLMPNLVETQTRELTSSRPTEYPLFPLDGLYPCHCTRRLLTNDEPLTASLTSPGRYWLLARMSEAKLRAFLDSGNELRDLDSGNASRGQASSDQSWRMSRSYNFGRLQLVELSIQE